MKHTTKVREAATVVQSSFFYLLFRAQYLDHIQIRPGQFQQNVTPHFLTDLLQSDLAYKAEKSMTTNRQYYLFGNAPRP